MINLPEYRLALDVAFSDRVKEEESIKKKYDEYFINIFKEVSGLDIGSQIGLSIQPRDYQICRIHSFEVSVDMVLVCFNIKLKSGSFGKKTYKLMDSIVIHQLNNNR